jgi:casein kinase II subunit alpha
MGVYYSICREMKNYVVHSKLGRGKYSHVFEGTDKRTGKRVAIKVLVPIHKDKIRREYHIQTSLNDPNIAKLL